VAFLVSWGWCGGGGGVLDYVCRCMCGETVLRLKEEQRKGANLSSKWRKDIPSLSLIRPFITIYSTSKPIRNHYITLRTPMNFTPNKN
jgi:hypothetical protein